MRIAANNNTHTATDMRTLRIEILLLAKSTIISIVPKHNNAVPNYHAGSRVSSCQRCADSDAKAHAEATVESEAEIEVKSSKVTPK